MRRLLLSLLFGAGLVLLPAGAASAADLVVNDPGDAGDAVKGNGVCATAGGVCTLRAAVEEAEALTGPDTITVPAMTISLGALVDISKTTTLQGAGGRATIITGSPGHILFRITGGDVVMRDLALQGASSTSGGAGLAIQQTGNAATILQRVRVVGNTVTGTSNTYGALYVTAGDMTVRDSEISGNTATSTSSGANGGGIYVQGGATRLFVENSTIHGNSAIAGGSTGWGGGIYVLSGTATVTSSTITNNTVENSVSIAAYGGNLTNFGALTVRDSIIGGGTADILTALNCYGTITFTGRNLVSNDTCGPAAATRTVAGAQLGPLQDNGGGTNSRSPALSSPAVDATANCARPSDQRGQQRPIGGGCELGSVELGADVTVSQEVSNVSPAPGSDVVITARVTNKGADAAAGGRFAATVQNVQSIVSVSASEGSCAVNGTAITCDLGVVPRAVPRTILIVARAPQQGVLSSAATVSSDLPDPIPADNSSVVNAEVPAAAATPAKPCGNVIKGTKKANRLRGTAAADRISGLGGDDILRGVGAADCLSGGRGDDRLLGGTGNDALNGGKGKDVLLAGAGDDTIRSRDGVRDVVKCGAGQDRVIADRRDRVAKDCEQVSKR